MILAGVSLCAHMIISHDHHITDTFSNQELNYPASDNKSDHSSGLPVHCHAFNDLVAEKFRAYQISNNTQYNFIAFHNFSDVSAFEIQVPCANIIDLQKLILDLYALELSRLRAPPSLA